MIIECGCGLILGFDKNYLIIVIIVKYCGAGILPALINLVSEV
jgi:hypothetical protein